MRDSPLRRASRLLFRLLSYRPPSVAVPPAGVVLADVRLVNPGSKPLPGQTLVVDGGTIAQVEPAGPGDTTGRYAGCCVLPGLIDMHVHFPPLLRDLCSLLFLFHGVTTVRDVGDADGTGLAYRRSVQAGEVPGPRIFACGPVLDGDPPFLPSSWRVRDAAEAEDAVATLAAQGVDFVKVHHRLSAAALDAVRQAAARRGLRLVGHIPAAIPFHEAGIWDVQHLDGLVPYPQAGDDPRSAQEGWARLASQQVDRYAATSRAQGLVHTPTLVSGESLLWVAEGGPPAGAPLHWMPRYYREVIWGQLGRMPMFQYMRDGLADLLRQSLQRTKDVVGALHAAGVRLHLGTDAAAMPYLVPGASLQRELALFVEAGVPLSAAWAAGTRSAGESLDVPGLGQLRPGAPADLAVYGEDPTRDVAALATLRAVVALGRLYTREALEEALAQHRACFERPAYDRAVTALVRGLLRMMAGRAAA